MTPQGLFGDLADAAPAAERFGDWWAAWPPNAACHGRKVGRLKCLTRWRARQYDDVADRIMRRLAFDKKSPQWNRDNGRYIPHPYTWLNREPWDEGAPAASTTPRPAPKPAPASPKPDPAVEAAKAHWASLAEEQRQACLTRARRRCKVQRLIEPTAIALAYQVRQRELGA